MRQHTNLIAGPSLTWTAYHRTTRQMTLLADQDLYEDASAALDAEQFALFDDAVGAPFPGTAVTFTAPRTLTVTVAAPGLDPATTAGDVSVYVGRAFRFRSVHTGQPVGATLNADKAATVVFSS